MIQEVKYSGLSANPSDHESPDGDLTTAINLIPEDGQLKPLLQPKTIGTLPSGSSVVHVHKTSNFTHYILKRGANLYWVEEDHIDNVDDAYLENHLIHKFIKLNDRTSIAIPIYQVSAVKNTLVVLAKDGIHYIKWDSKNTSYQYIGQKPPFIELSFGLSDNKLANYIGNQYGGIYTIKSNYAVCYTSQLYPASCNIDNSAGLVYFNRKASESFTEELWATVNTANAMVSRDGHFYAPFFVRYCYRMYDGTMWMQSAPVFMPVSMPVAINAFIPQATIDENNNITINTGAPDNPAVISYLPQNVALTGKLLQGDITALKNTWGDIISSIDIFVSLPLLREDSSEKIKQAFISTARDCYNLRINTLVKQNYETITNDDPPAVPDKRLLLEIPMLSSDAYLDKIHAVDNFYKVKSFELDNFNISSDNYTEVEIDKSVLPVLATQETLKDDYKSHNTLLPFERNGTPVTRLFINNSRLYVTAPSERLFGGFHSGALVPRCTSLGELTVKKIYIYLKTEDGERVVKWEDDTGFTSTRTIMEHSPLFYPDNRAVRMKAFVEYEDLLSQTVRKCYNFTMQQCPMLNGAMTKGGIFDYTHSDNNWSDVDGEFPFISVKDIIHYPYKIYVSDVNNPFFFPSQGINSVGSGIIMGVATVNTPVSTGQYGFSDVYIFSTDGVWVAKIQNDGGLHDINPGPRDICNNPDSIIQLKDSAVFATERGIMLISGSTSSCISDVISSEYPFDVFDNLPQADNLHSLLGHDADTCLPTLPFRIFLDGCRMIYDYLHQRVIVFNPQYSYAYVFSLKSKLWGMMYSSLASTVNAYPEALAIDKDNHIVSFSDSDESTCNALFITRPLKLGSGDILKSVHTVIQRGMFQRGDVKTVLYGSRDLYSWVIVASSIDEAIRNIRGTSYKYFRVAAVASLSPDKSIQGASIALEQRYNNRLR